MTKMEIENTAYKTQDQLNQFKEHISKQLIEKIEGKIKVLQELQQKGITGGEIQMAEKAIAEAKAVTL